MLTTINIFHTKGHLHEKASTSKKNVKRLKAFYEAFLGIRLELNAHINIKIRLIRLIHVNKLLIITYSYAKKWRKEV